MNEKVNLDKAFAGFTEQWSPRVVAALNGQEVKIARLEGEFVWHEHPDADEMFLVLAGRLEIRLRGDTVPGTKVIVLHPGDLYTVPRGVEHRPVADADTRILLFEPAGTINTGTTESERTIQAPVRLIADDRDSPGVE